MTSIPRTAEDERLAFRQMVKDLVAKGQIDQALDFCTSKAEQAESEGDQGFFDQARALRAQLFVQGGRGDEVVPELRRLLLRTTDLPSRFYAAYAISCHYDMASNASKGHFYAKQALSVAQQWADRTSIAAAHNQLANLLALDSFFDAAEAEYQKALDLQDPVDSTDRAMLLANIGYCHVVSGRLRQGYSDLAASLRMLRRLGSEAWLHVPMMGLSYACLEVGKPARARTYAERALELSEQMDNPDSVKKCLYLLGEAQKYCGRTTAAYESFSALQRRFYPENPMVVDFLMAADVRRMINLMA